MVLFSCVNTIEQLLIHQVAPLWLVCHPDFYMSYRLSDFCRDFVKGGGIPLQCTGVGPERKTFENLRAPAHLSSLIVRLPLLSSVFVLRAARWKFRSRGVVSRRRNDTSSCPRGNLCTALLCLDSLCAQCYDISALPPLLCNLHTALLCAIQSVLWCAMQSVLTHSVLGYVLSTSTRLHCRVCKCMHCRAPKNLEIQISCLILPHTFWIWFSFLHTTACTQHTSLVCSKMMYDECRGKFDFTISISHFQLL